MAQIGSLAWKLPYASGVAEKAKKKNKKKTKKKNPKTQPANQPNKKRPMIPNVSKNVEQKGLSYNARSSVKCYNYFIKVFRSFL